MSRDTGKALSSPVIILVGIGAIIDVILIVLMFKFADEENLFMVLLISALIGVVALGIAKGLVSISRNNYGK
ncbi:MAG: hypothetical protein PHG79_06555 [Methanosarcina sp.]|mgnify:CR=1 FL=1|jgi:hypothetical protein|nr:hypothetical protein [Methanosarcina sp.]MDD3872988.1 hypothetical protein [Methanosarcina sp.]MDD4522894.1 hypothetical protein [Methanosarcina sp.]HHV23628.1 hypothetical protein [Methanosarcina sp.]